MIYYPGRHDDETSAEATMVIVMNAAELEELAGQVMALANGHAITMQDMVCVFVREDDEARQEAAVDAICEKLGIDELDEDDEEDEPEAESAAAAEVIDVHGETVPAPAGPTPPRREAKP